MIPNPDNFTCTDFVDFGKNEEVLPDIRGPKRRRTTPNARNFN